MRYHQKDGKKLASELGQKADFCQVDVLKESEICEWIKKVNSKFGFIRTLVNNAACDQRIPLLKTSSQNWDPLQAINLRAYFLTSREFPK